MHLSASISEGQNGAPVSYLNAASATAILQDLGESFPGPGSSQSPTLYRPGKLGPAEAVPTFLSGPGEQLSSVHSVPSSYLPRMHGNGRRVGTTAGLSGLGYSQAVPKVSFSVDSPSQLP